MTDPRRISVAPMLDWTDRHYRFFMRGISRRAMLYTEMITTGAILYGKGDFLAFDEDEHPVALQLGGSDPAQMAQCARIAEQRGYDEVNINVGCPSDRVKNGRFGACLMAEPELVARCVEAMGERVRIPVTVKCRIGIDDMDEQAALNHFVDTVAQAGCRHFIIHARKAWLQGLSPKENRDIPPLNYERVYQLKRDNPELHIALNGGVKTLDEAQQHLTILDGVMIGREAYSNPFLFAEVDQRFFNEPATELDREAMARRMIPYIDKQVAQGAKPWHVARHMLGLFQGQPGGRKWRRYLSENGTRAHSGELIADALMARSH